MKVTMASERLLRTVVDEGLEHFICDDGKGIYAVRKDEVKIVQEWVDVTHECCAVNAQLRHGSLDVHASAWFGNGHYRLRKIDATVHGFPHPAYFIVERKDKA